MNKKIRSIQTNITNEEEAKATLFISNQKVIEVGKSRLYISLTDDFEYHYFMNRKDIPFTSDNPSIHASQDLRSDLKIVFKYIFDNWTSLTNEEFKYVIVNEAFLNYHFNNEEFNLLPDILSEGIQYIVKGYNMPTGTMEKKSKAKSSESKFSKYI